MINRAKPSEQNVSLQTALAGILNVLMGCRSRSSEDYKSVRKERSVSLDGGEEK